MRAIVDAIAVYTFGAFISLLCVILSETGSPFRPADASDEAEFVVDAATVILWPLIVAGAALLVPVGLWFGACYVGTGIADLWDMRPRRQVPLPKMRVKK